MQDSSNVSLSHLRLGLSSATDHSGDPSLRESLRHLREASDAELAGPAGVVRSPGPRALGLNDR